MFYIKCRNLNERGELISYLKKRDISAVFHYIPLHSAPAGIKYGRFCGADNYTTVESEKILRLPMYYGLRRQQVSYICEQIRSFYFKS